MSITRFLPQAAEAFRRLKDVHALARAAAVPVAISLAAPILATQTSTGGILAEVVNALAFGMFGVAWMRHVVGRAQPARPVHLRLGGREALYGLINYVFNAFAMVPMVLSAMLVQELQLGWLPMPLVGTLMLQAFMILIGAIYLMLADTALAEKGSGGPKLNEIVQAGGLAVGLGYILCGLPFSLAITAFGALVPPAETTEVRLIHQAVLVVPTYLAAAVTGGFLAMCWTELKATVKPRG